jgi:hypothetical protein
MTAHSPEATLTAQPPEAALKELTALAPVRAPAFAFSFVIGYFGGIDISWLSFFSISDQVLFALRALPVAITASAFFCRRTKLQTPIKTTQMARRL